MSKQTALKLEKRYGKHCVNNLGEANGTQVEDRYNREICIIIKLEWVFVRGSPAVQANLPCLIIVHTRGYWLNFTIPNVQLAIDRSALI